MYTLLIEGVAPLPDDARIVQSLLIDGRSSGEFPECRVGIAGPDGRPYRSIVARGLYDLAAIDKTLKGFGFVEAPAEGIFQAVYHRSLEWMYFRGDHIPYDGRTATFGAHAAAA